MLKEQAIVTARKGDQVEVRLARNSACGQCELRTACGVGAIGRLLGKRDRPLLLGSDQSLKPGDRLQLEISERALVRGSLIVYGFPLLGLLAGGLVAVSLKFTDGWVALASLLGFILGLTLAHHRARRLEESGFTPHIVDIQLNPEPKPES